MEKRYIRDKLRWRFRRKEAIEGLIEHHKLPLPVDLAVLVLEYAGHLKLGNYGIQYFLYL
jgi:hypothetical protein